MSEIYIPEERKLAWERYKKAFGSPFPDYFIYCKFGDNWEAEVAEIDRRIREKDPAPNKKIPKGVLF